MFADDERILTISSKVLNETILIGGDGSHDWSLRAVRSMSKALRKHNQFDAFYDILMNNTGVCCPMNNEKLPGSFGRIHLFIMKLFRFPWIRFEAQLKSNISCRYPLKKKNTQICINLWHCKPIDIPAPALPPVIVNKGLDFGAIPVKIEEDEEESENGPDSTDAPDHPDWSERYVPNVTINGDEIRRQFDSFAFDNVPANPLSPESPPLDFRPTEEGGGQATYQSGLSSPASTMQSPRFFNEAMEVEEKIDEEKGEEVVDDEDKAEDDEEGEEEKETNRPQTPSEKMPKYLTGLGKIEKMNGQYECVEYEETTNWISLVYYEESTALCDEVHFFGSHLLVDGFTNAMQVKDRFSIGFFNNEKRSSLTTETRACVGRGLRFYYFGGSVYIESLTNSPIFVQSLSANLRHNFHINTVTKLPPFASMKVFDNEQFAKQIAEAAEKSYQDVYALSKMCTIKVSFVKGWGAHYKRTSIMRAPCWIQAHLNGPLTWIDKVLRCMGSPPMICSSRT